MGNAIHRLLPLVLAAFLVACGAEAPRLEPLDRDATLLAFGDSITRGVGAAKEASYPAVLAELTGHEVVNAGVSGEVSREGRERLPQVLERVRPDLLLLCHGGNDLLRGLPKAQLRANLRAMVMAARERGIQVVLIGVPEPAVFSSGSADAYREVAGSLQVPLEADALPAIERDAALKSDPIHPNAAGYRRLAEAVQRLLAARGAL